MPKRKPPGNKLTDSGIRPIEKWREWASVSLPSFKVYHSPRPDGHVGPYDPIWTIEENGVVIGTWLDSDAPWLSGWASLRMGQLHGSWHVARQALEVFDAQSATGKARKKILQEEASAMDAKIKKRAEQIVDSDGPMPMTELAAKVADSTGRGKEALRHKLPKLTRK